MWIVLFTGTRSVAFFFSRYKKNRHSLRFAINFFVLLFTHSFVHLYSFRFAAFFLFDCLFG